MFVVVLTIIWWLCPITLKHKGLRETRQRLSPFSHPQIAGQGVLYFDLIYKSRWVFQLHDPQSSHSPSLFRAWSSARQCRQTERVSTQTGQRQRVVVSFQTRQHDQGQLLGLKAHPLDHVVGPKLVAGVQVPVFL